jgi:hypothetical protein
MKGQLIFRIFVDILPYLYEFFILRDFIICSIIRSPWHLCNSSETTGTSSNKGTTKKNMAYFQECVKISQEGKA